LRRTLIILLILSTFACKGGSKKDEQYKTEKIDRGNVTMTVTATGTISAVTTVQVGSQVSGVISRLYANFNSHVTQGQLLAELDPTPMQAQVEQRRADVTKAQVETGNARITYERQRRLEAAGLVAQAELDAAKAQYDSAQAQVQQAAAALRQAETNLKYTKILSPIDGVVIDRQYDVGQTVAASFQAPTLFSIAQDLEKLQVQADVDQSDIGRIQVGQLARFNVDAFPDREFRGRISEIRLNAGVNQNVVSYPVIIEVANPGELLKPKMTANVTIEVAQVNDVLRVANAALRFRPADAKDDKTAPATTSGGGDNTDRRAIAMGGRQRGAAGAAGALGGGQGGARPKKAQTIYIMGDSKDRKLKPLQIRTGISDGRYTEIVEGEVKPGDLVVVGLATSKVEGPAAFGGQAGPGGGGRPAGGGRGGR
jgi:HlyD family secretion protein